MTRKDFIQLAKGLAKIADAASHKQAVEAVAEVCANDNERFDHALFTEFARLCWHGEQEKKNHEKMR